jgi:hypothetical protein
VEKQSLAWPNESLAWPNEEGMVSNLEHLAPLGASKHSCLKFIFNCYLLNTNKHIPKYLYHKADFPNMKKDLSEENWEELLKDKNVTETWDIIENKIITAMVKYIPKSRPKSASAKRKPLWMTDAALTKVKKKYHSYKRYISTKDGKDYDLYARARNQSKWMCKKVMTEFERKIAAESKTNAKAFFNYARSKMKTRSPVSDLILEDGKVASTDQEKAEALNNFFSSVFTIEDSSNLPSIEETICQSNLKEMVFTEEIVKKQLDKLKCDKTPGPDGIHPKVLREMSEVLAGPLSILFTRSMTESVLPQGWKQSHVAPIFKKGPKSKTCNYRPVSLTAIICKVMERIVRDSLMDHLIQNSILSSCQHGFIPGRSCVTQLLVIMDMWTQILDDHGTIDVAYLDFAKAFDKVPHERLLVKLKGYGVDGQVLGWIRSFLTGRQQRVVVNGSESPWSPVTSGIPQGSVLGPVLFIIFINDMPDAVHSLLLMFADDAKVFRRVDSVEGSTRLQEDLRKLSEWADKWLMTFNASKCKVMHLGYKNERVKYYLPERGKDVELIETESERDLGVVFDSKLTFSKHCEEQVNKANRILGMIRASYTYIDCGIMKQLFKGLVRPYLEYGNVVWSPQYLKDARLVENVQRRATRLVPGMKGLDYEERLQKMELPSLFYRRARGDLIEVYKFLNDMYQVDHDLFLRDMNSSTRGHCLKLKTRKSRLEVRRHFFGVRVVSYWNRLPEEVILAPSVNAFKNRLDKHLRQHHYVQYPLY